MYVLEDITMHHDLSIEKDNVESTKEEWLEILSQFTDGEEIVLGDTVHIVGTNAPVELIAALEEMTGNPVKLKTRKY